MYKIKKAGEHHILQIAKLAHLLWPSEDLAIIKKASATPSPFLG